MHARVAVHRALRSKGGADVDDALEQVQKLGVQGWAMTFEDVFLRVLASLSGLELFSPSCYSSSPRGSKA